MIDYIRHSSITISVQLNPLLWRVGYLIGGPDDMNPGAYTLVMNLLMIRLNVFIDNGSW
jgi:hypothetical protein